MLADLKKRQYAFTRSRDVSDGAVKASYLIQNELVQASKPFYDGERVEICMVMAVEVVCLEEQSAFANIILSRNIIADRVEYLSRKMGSQIQDKIKSFIAFADAINESADVTENAQLYVFIRGVEESLTVTEEFAELVSMKDTTTACDVFSCLVTTLDKTGVDGSSAVSLIVDGALSMVGRNAGVARNSKKNFSPQT